MQRLDAALVLLHRAGGDAEAVREAEAVLMEAAPIRMSAEGFAAFMEALERPALPVPEIVEVLRRTAPWETDTDRK